MQVEPVDKRYGRPILIIDFMKIPEKKFKASSVFTAEQILRDLQEFVENSFFILQEVPGEFLGKYQEIWAKETISLPKGKKKSNLCRFADEISFNDGEVSEENALRKIDAILSFALSEQGSVKKLYFASPEYKEKIVYFHNSLWFRSLGKIRSRHFWEADVQICDEIFVTYKRSSSSRPNASFWEVIILKKPGEDLDLFCKDKFRSRDLALESISEKLINSPSFGQDETAMEIIKCIEEIEESSA